MKVHIEKNLYLESDERQFILKEYTGKQTTSESGKITDLFKLHGYYTSVESAINGFVKMKIRESTATNLKELITSFREIKEYIAKEIKF